MMEKYIARSRVAGALDALGARVLIVIVCMGWFIYLWGLSLPAIAAGLSLSALCLLCVRRFDKRTLTKREAALRRRIGGELALEALLTQKDSRAQFQAAMWLLPKYPFTLLRVTKSGIVCEMDGKSVLTRIVNKHADSPVTLDELVLALRDANAEKREQVYLCLTSKLDRAARTYAETAPITLIERDELIELAGAASPATDEQLVLLKKRRKKAPRFKAWIGQALSPKRAKSYFVYGLGMAALYFFTGQPFYPVPAVVCLSLCVVCLSLKARGSGRSRP